MSDRQKQVRSPATPAKGAPSAKARRSPPPPGKSAPAEAAAAKSTKAKPGNAKSPPSGVARQGSASARGKPSAKSAGRPTLDAALKTAAAEPGRSGKSAKPVKAGKPSVAPAVPSPIVRSEEALRNAPGGELDLAIVQRMQDAVAAAAGMVMQLRSPDGVPMTRLSGPDGLPPELSALDADGRPTDGLGMLERAGFAVTAEPLRSNHALVGGWSTVEPPASAHRDGSDGVGPVSRLGSLLGRPAGAGLSDREAAVVRAMWERSGPVIAAQAELLACTADLVGRAYGRRLELRRRDKQLHALAAVSDLVVGGRNLTSVLKAVARIVTETMQAKAALVRLVDETGAELVPRAVHNLSWQFIAKGPVKIADSAGDRAAFAGEIVEIHDLATDPRSIYREEAVREGLASALVVAMTHAGEPIGVLRVYSEHRRSWSADEKELLRAVADQAAAAVVNSRLLEEVRLKERMDREIRLGREVQRRMLPDQAPSVEGFELGAVYEPSSSIAGDFYDFPDTGDGTIGLVVGDVMGKGVPAALWMAGVRATLRAVIEHECGTDDPDPQDPHASLRPLPTRGGAPGMRNAGGAAPAPRTFGGVGRQARVPDVARIVTAVNRALVRDAVRGQFATVFFGVLDPVRRRLVWCNAGHEPPVLFRDGKAEPVEGGSPLLGVMPDAAFTGHAIDLRPGDVLVAWTDGTTDAMNFFEEPFGRERVLAAVQSRLHEPADAIARHVLWDIRRFAGLNARMDDVTIVVLKADVD